MYSLEIIIVMNERAQAKYEEEKKRAEAEEQSTPKMSHYKQKKEVV